MKCALLAIPALPFLVLSCAKPPVTAVAAKSPPVLAGSAYLIAPIKNAHVTIHRLTPGASNEFIADTMTDDEGAFELTLPQSTDGDLLVSVVGDRGGGTIEPITGAAPISLSETDVLTTLAIGTHLGDKTTVTVNPVTTLVTARAMAEFSAGAKLADAWHKNTTLFSAHLNTASPWHSTPTDLTQQAAPGLSSGVIYSLVLLGLSEHAVTLGARAGVTDVSVVNTLVLLRALVADLSDGVFDGRAAGSDGSVNVVGNVNIDTETTRLSLATAIDAFLDSGSNKTGLGKLDVSLLTSAIRQDTSELYASTSAPQQIDITSQSGAGPVITIMAPTTGQTLGKTDSIVGHATDGDGISDVTISIDGVDIGASANVDTSLNGNWTWSFVPTVGGGAHVLQISSTDSQRNTTSKQVSFSFDDTGPSIAFVSCSASDDRERQVTVTGVGATFTDTTLPASCTDAALQSGSQAFHTFADLFDANTKVPTINLNVTDSAGVASVVYQVRINGTLTKNSSPLDAAESPSTHALRIGSSLIGATGADLHAADSYEIDVIATDNNGNVTTRPFLFTMAVLPTPLYVAASTAPDASVALGAHSFASGNVDSIFAQSYDPSKPCGSNFCQAFPGSLVQLSRFLVTNVSSRPIYLNTDWATATTGAVSFTRTVFRTSYYSTQTFARNGSGPCSEITDVQASGYQDTGGGTFPAWTPNWSTQSCKTVANDLKPGKLTENVTFTPVVRVFKTSDNSAVIGSVVTLSPGVQYAVVIALYNPTLGTNGRAWPTEPNLGNGGGYGNIATSARLPLGYGGASSSGSFWKRNRIIYTTSEIKAWGLVGSDWASNNYNDLAFATRVRAMYVAGDNLNHLLSPIVFERRLSFSSNVSWLAPIAMGATEPTMIGTGDHQERATLSSFTDEPPKPDLCSLTNQLCNNVDMSGW